MDGWVSERTESFLRQLMSVWQRAFQSVKEVRAEGSFSGTRNLSGEDCAERGGAAAETDGTDWWDDVSHQAQRVAHVAAASAFAAGGGEVRAKTQGLNLRVRAVQQWT